MNYIVFVLFLLTVLCGFNCLNTFLILHILTNKEKPSTDIKLPLITSKKKREDKKGIDKNLVEGLTNILNYGLEVKVDERKSD